MRWAVPALAILVLLTGCKFLKLDFGPTERAVINDKEVIDYTPAGLFHLEESDLEAPVILSVTTDPWPLRAAAPGWIVAELADEHGRALDDAALHYYKNYNTRNTDYPQLLADADGQCGAWAKLLLASVLFQGIGSRSGGFIYLPASGGASGFLVKEWRFDAGDIQVSRDPGYPYINILHTVTEDGYVWLYQEAYPEEGIYGQSNRNPASMFNNHQLTKLPMPGYPAGKYLDPSYGLAFESVEDFKENAIAAFYLDLGDVRVEEAYVGIDLDGDGRLDSVVYVNVLLTSPSAYGRGQLLELNSPW